jgi:hypothetical protein
VHAMRGCDEAWLSRWKVDRKIECGTSTQVVVMEMKRCSRLLWGSRTRGNMKPSNSAFVEDAV